MKIRRSIIGLCVAAVVMLVLVVWYIRRPAATPPAKEDASAETAEQSPAMMSSDRSEAIPAALPRSNDAAATTNPNAVVSAPAPAKAERAREVLSALNDVPIDFYGKLQDQFTNPVAGAEITGSIIYDNGHSNGVRIVKTVSDANGFFEFHGGNGESLSVVPRKKGYALASSKAGFDYSHFYPESRHVADLSQPAVIQMWKLLGSEPLLRLNQKYRLRYTSDPIHFDLLARKVVPNGGDIKLTVNRSAGVISLRSPQDWNVEVEAINGGLMSSLGEEAITYWAPESGYQARGNFVFSTNVPHKWFEGFNQGFFVVTRNGQVYSKLGLTFRINEEPDGFMHVRFSGVANTNGSRNWEGDSNTMKQIGQ